MAGGDHDAAVQTEVEGREVDLLRAALTDVDDVGAGTHQTGGQRLGDLGTGQADIVTDDDAPGAEKLDVGSPDIAGQLRVQLVGNPAPDVVGFEAGEAFRSFRHGLLSARKASLADGGRGELFSLWEVRHELESDSTRTRLHG